MFFVRLYINTLFSVLKYIFRIFKEPETNPNVILFSLIALEKFAQSSQNKVTILNKLKKIQPSPVLTLENWKIETHYVKRQAGFCAQWILDNICKFI